MATATRDVLLECAGYRLVGADGPIGRVEEAWLGPDDEPAAVAVRRLDGRRGLLLALDVDSVDRQEERVEARPGSRLLEIDGDGAIPLALHPAGARERDPSIVRALALLFSGLALLIAFEIALDFAIAYLVTGRAY
jgi:hypothetical protein